MIQKLQKNNKTVIIQKDKTKLQKMYNMLRFKALTIDGEMMEFNFEDIEKVYKQNGVFFLCNHPINKLPLKIDSVKVIEIKKEE